MTLPLTATSQAIADRLAALECPPTLHGPRVRLRALRDEDAQGLLALFGDARVTRFWSRPPLTQREEAQALLERAHNEFAARTALEWAIAGEDDALIGSCKLFRIAPAHRRAELGYALHPDHWGRGVAGEAVRLALGWGFGTLELHRIDADIDPDNQASRSLLLRLGFQIEGRLRESFFVGDRVTDSEKLGLLARDWPALAG